MATAYLICFFVGILFVFVTAIMSGVFGGGESSSADAGDFDAGGHDIDVGGHDIDVAGHDIDIGGHDVDIGGHEAGAGGHDVDVSGPDGDFDTDVSGHDVIVMGAGVHLSPLSPTVISVFVTSFGGFGYLAWLAFGGDKPFIHVPIAVFSGFVLGLGTFLLFNKIFQATTATSHYTRRQLIGLTAEVLITIPKDGAGEIAFVAGGAQSSSPARSEKGKTHPAHSRVIITHMKGGTAYVRESPEEKFERLKRRNKPNKKGKEQRD